MGEQHSGLPASAREDGLQDDDVVILYPSDLIAEDSRVEPR